jgi:hypothetical protein
MVSLAHAAVAATAAPIATKAKIRALFFKLVPFRATAPLRPVEVQLPSGY